MTIQKKPPEIPWLHAFWYLVIKWIASSWILFWGLPKSRHDFLVVTPHLQLPLGFVAKNHH